MIWLRPFIHSFRPRLYDLGPHTFLIDNSIFVAGLDKDLLEISRRIAQESRILRRYHPHDLFECQALLLQTGKVPYNQHIDQVIGIWQMCKQAVINNELTIQLS